jgi:AbrB family looped-hinge helix DNA binding protein
MRPTFATVSAKGQLVIPSEMRAQLGIEVGTKVALTTEGTRIILQPVTSSLVDELCGITAGHGSMTDELLAERRAQHQRDEEEIQAWLRDKAAQ